MRSVNKVILIGNLTRDPQMKQTQNGQTVTTFGIATNREWVTSDGESKKSTEFHEVVAWGKLAEICNTYLRKGKLVYLEGYLKTRSWEMENGEKKYRTEIVINDMIMLNKRSKEDDGDFVPEGVSTETEVEEPDNKEKAEKTTKDKKDESEENVF
ncbi:single-stranded DNA-binding protein [Patescibacteria group bacterium]